MSRIVFSIGIILLIGAYSSCDDPERTVLTRSEKELLDSLYSKQISFARKYADSICDATYQVMFDRAADSIKREYIREIRQIVDGE